MGEAASPALASPSNPIYVRSTDDRLWQGEIIESVPQVRLALESIQANGATDALEVEIDPHPRVIVLSQDCDLDQDFNARKAGKMVLPNVLLCDVFPAEELRAVLQTRETLGGKDWKIIRQNNNGRFQYLRSVATQEDALAEGLPALAVDFRLYFSIRTDELYKRLEHKSVVKRCRLDTPFAEHLCDRFYHYMARIALPVNHADGGVE